MVEYKLLKELPFMAVGTVFMIYGIDAGKRDFYVENTLNKFVRLFNTYENGILRSILEKSDWIERRVY